MKKTLILVVIVGAFISACKKSSTNPTSANPSIVGKWIHTKDIVKNYSTTGQYNLTDTAVYNNNNVYYQFNSDGTGIINSETFIGSGQYSGLSFNYHLNGLNLSLTANNQTESATIQTLTSSTLIINTTSNETDVNGTITSTDKITEYFSK